MRIYTIYYIFELFRINYSFWTFQGRQMKQILKLLVFACCCCHIKGVIHAGKCADGWLEYGSYCYLFNSEQQNKNWKDSLLTCQSYGGNLLSIKDEGENLFILNQLKTNAMKNNPYWIGLSKLNGERKFMWSDNTSLLFVYWKANEPNNYNNSNEDCVEVNVYGWNDSPCNYIRGFICKAKLDTQMDSCIHGLVEKDILNISLQLNGNGYNATIEYFFPLFVTFASESVLHGFTKPNFAQFKYIFSGYFVTNGTITHNITLKVNKKECFKDFLIEIPVKLSYQNIDGKLKVVTMVYQKTCLYKVSPKISRDKNALSGTPKSPYSYLTELQGEHLKGSSRILSYQCYYTCPEEVLNHGSLASELSSPTTALRLHKMFDI
ncbi:uncharacterized protein LOC136087256 isoform X2 [Hydra vulgaris]|uniref:Uncharacterized protein LOC136087256 isoform X2 n=1 Tax=Hydra vulgaris TaxID=6087 RepID=A0ABM4CV28_HYDVU